MTKLSPVPPSLASASEDISAGRLSPLELTEACVERVEALEPALQAFVTLDAEGAIAQARTLTDEIATGTSRGALHGIPVAVKDIIDVKGLPTTASSKILEGNVAETDAPVVAGLRRAGAVILGKTTTHEFAYGTVCRPTVNPWDVGRIPGGSSGGSAVAVAAGMCPGALGTDTAGSIRIPAALCGVSGLKPRPGIISLDGVIPLAPSLDVCGPIAGSALDISIMWEALSGVPTASGSPEPPRLARPDFSAVVEVDPEVEALVSSALEQLSDAGTTIVACDLPRFEEWDRPRSMLLMSEALEVHRSAGWFPARAADYTEETLSALEYATRFDAQSIEEARRKVDEFVRELLAVFEHADVLALPTTPVPAPTIAESQKRDAEHRTPVARTLTRICGPVNVARLAAVSVPCGFTKGGLPVGVQFVGRDERTAFAAGFLYQSITEWHHRVPPALQSRAP